MKSIKEYTNSISNSYKNERTKDKYKRRISYLGIIKLNTILIECQSNNTVNFL